MTQFLSVIRWLWRLGASAAWLPVFALALLVTLNIQILRGVHDVDIFWQILLGKITLLSGLPAHEPLLAHQQHAPYVAFYWLGQIVYHLGHALGGWPLLRLLDAALWLGGFAVVARQCLRRHGNAWPAVAALAVGVGGAMPFASLRLQSFSVLAFGLLIVLIRSSLTNRSKLLLALPLLLLWQNLHPSVIVAVVYLGLRAAWAVLTPLRKADADSPRLMIALTLCAAVAIVLTPVGFEIFRLSAYNGEISKHLGITEWQPMWVYDFDEYGRRQGWIAICIMTFVLAVTAFVAPRAVAIADLLPLLAFTGMSIYCHRFSLQWGVLVVPVLADAFTGWFRRMPPPETNATPRRTLLRRVIIFAACWPALAWPLYNAPELFADYYPFAAVNSLKKQTVRGAIFCDYFWGGVVAERGWPDWQPTHDGRYFIRPKEHWDLYFDKIANGAVPLSELEAEYQPTAWLLRKGTYDGLIALLRESPRWVVVHDDELSVAFIRRGE